MKKKELEKLIIKIINDEELKDLKGYEWDSLAHLSILMELDKIYPDKITIEVILSGYSLSSSLNIER